MNHILNLGAGNRPILADAGRTVVNHDRTAHHDYISSVHDLNVLPWPWEDNQFTEICARAVFEHLQHNLYISMDECWRILAPGGVCEVKVPVWNHPVTFTDATHIQGGYALGVFDVIDPETKRGKQYGFYGFKPWKIIRPAALNNSQTSIIVLLEVRK